jgi:hypothetical protein
VWRGDDSDRSDDYEIVRHVDRRRTLGLAGEMDLA